MASITLNNIKKTYEDGVTVIENLNLEIKDKEFIVFVGPSGCGKSTLLSILCNLEKKSEGEIKETIPFTIASKRTKYLGINLPKEAKNVYSKNFIHLRRPKHRLLRYV